VTESVFNPVLLGDDEPHPHPYGPYGPFPYQHAVVDLETMAGPPDGAIVSIGFCYFDIRTGEIGPKFERNVDLDSSLKAGMKWDKRTIGWWAEPAQASAYEHMQQNTIPLTQMLMELTDFIDEHKCHPCLWGNGSSFDNVILGSAFRLTGLTFRCHFRQWRDMRTWVREIGKNIVIENIMSSV